MMEKRVCVMCGEDYMPIASRQRTCGKECSEEYLILRQRMNWRRKNKRDFSDIVERFKGLPAEEREALIEESSKLDRVRESRAGQQKEEKAERKLSEIAEETGRSYSEVQVEDTWKKIRAELPPIVVDEKGGGRMKEIKIEVGTAVVTVSMENPEITVGENGVAIREAGK